jgi:ABC-type glycerol-3-phosphate transport system substrate-binding protein
MLRNILLGVGLFATLLAVLIFSGRIQVGSKETKLQGEVNIWGTLPETGMNAVVQQFNPQAKTYVVRYRYIPEAAFAQQLLEGLANGTGPDMILTSYQTILSQQSRIQPFPLASFSEKTYKDMYVDGASVLFTSQGALALPVSVDPMVLFYNRTLLSKRGVANPPTYWDEVVKITPDLVLRNGDVFTETAIALGTPNTPYAKDIIMAIIAQLGQVPVVQIPMQGGGIYNNVLINSPAIEGGEVLPLSTTMRFFTQFADPGQGAYSWNQMQGNASDVFVGEKLAMYIGYAGELGTLRAQNPRAQFEMTYLPQTRGYNTFATGMRMYALATLKNSKNMQASLVTQMQFAGAGVSPAIAAVAKSYPPLRAYAANPNVDPVLVKSMLVARGWYDPREKESSTYIETMISDIISYRQGVTEAVNTFVLRFRDLYAMKYN